MASHQRKQIEMNEAEVATFLDQHRTAALATVGPSGAPHVVAMWYAVIEGEIWFESKAAAQKVRNVSRTPLATVLVEDGLTYDTLRGVEVEGTASIVDDADQLWSLGIAIWERYNGPYSEEVKPLLEYMLHKRVAIRVVPQRIRTWDHRKLGMDPIPLGGSTATYLSSRESS